MRNSDLAQAYRASHTHLLQISRLFVLPSVSVLFRPITIVSIVAQCVRRSRSVATVASREEPGLLARRVLFLSGASNLDHRSDFHVGILRRFNLVLVFVFPIALHLARTYGNAWGKDDAFLFDGTVVVVVLVLLLLVGDEGDEILLKRLQQHLQTIDVSLLKGVLVDRTSSMIRDFSWHVFVVVAAIPCFFVLCCVCGKVASENFG